MPLGPFRASAPLTLGVELELQLVGPADLNLAEAGSDMLALLGRRDFPGTVVPEIAESMIEVSSGVHTSYVGLLAQLRAMRDALLDAGDRLNVGVCGGGTHPFQSWHERRIHPKERFQRVSTLYGYLAKQFTVFGQHIHVGCADGDTALTLLHSLGRYVPHFIALAASSPFVQGVDTSFDSARLNSVSAFPLSGRAPFVLSWRRFEDEHFAKLEAIGIVGSMKDFYWDIRPKPEYGTIELRVCDTPLTVAKAAALAGYLKALAWHILDGRDPPPREDDYLVYGYNRFQACRFGLDGQIVRPADGARVRIGDDILRVLDTLRRRGDFPADLRPALAEIGRFVADGSDAQALRERRRRTRGLEGVVAWATRRFRED